MNQDSFRRLLEASQPSATSSSPTALGAASTSRSRLVVQPTLAPANRKIPGEVVSKPAFKPRNIRRQDDAKLDRDPPDKGTNVNNVDVEPPAPSRGLDFALLDQEKAKAGLLSTNDVDELEQAFAESSVIHNSEEVAPRKRTREDLIRELKEKRTKNAGQPTEPIKEDAQMEEAKMKSKFKPIGFSSTSKRKKDDPSKADRKKKKRKVDNDTKDLESQVKPKPVLMTSPAKPMLEQSTPAVDDDFDIFADAGEYTGVEIDDNEEAETASPHLAEETSSLPQRWIAMDEPEHVPPTKPQQSTQLAAPVPEETKVGADQELEEHIRLAPLESSAVPSIKELLEMHDAADKYEKKSKRKEKKRKRGGKGKGSDDE